MILKPLIDDLKESPDFALHFNQSVTKIHYSPNGVRVISKNTKTDEESEFTGDQVVCTASIGVLLNELIAFEPALPAWKLKAIRQYEIAGFCKVFVSFKKKFWKNQRHIIIANQKRGYYPYWIATKGTNTLLGIIVGDEAKRVE